MTAPDVDRADVEAAGCLLARAAVGGGGVEVLLVHRSATRERGADWGLPKGKLDDGEHPAAAALRETAEETGLRVHLGPPLPEQRYDLPDGRSKRVRWWAVLAGDGEAGTPSPDEVDEVAWLGPGPARARLTHAADRALLDDALAAGALDPDRPTWPLVLLRHARAVRRTDWTRGEDDRPLLERGHHQARDLAPVLDAWDVRRFVTSPWARCVQTVLPAAELTGLPVVEDAALTEAAHRADPRAAPELLEALLAAGEGAVVCSHGPVLPDLQELLAERVAEDAPAVGGRLRARTAKGELVVAHVAGRGSDARVVAAERHRM